MDKSQQYAFGLDEGLFPHLLHFLETTPTPLKLMIASHKTASNLSILPPFLKLSQLHLLFLSYLFLYLTLNQNKTLNLILRQLFLK